MVAPSEPDKAEVIFDSKEYLDSFFSIREMEEEEIDASLDLGRTSAPSRCVFILLKPLKEISIVDLFNVGVEKAKDRGIQKLIFIVKSQAIREFLLEENPPVEHLVLEFQLHGPRLVLMNGDITEVSADAIVNASNTRLVLREGVLGAIRQKAGPWLQA